MIIEKAYLRVKIIVKYETKEENRNMNIDNRKLEIILMALKEAFLNRSLDEGVKVIQGEFLNDLNKNICTYADQVEFKIKGIISQAGLNRLNIPEDHREYIICIVQEIIEGLPLNHELLMNCSYDVKKLEDCLWRKYKIKNTSGIECENEIKKVLQKILYIVVDCLKQEDTFIPEVAIGLYREQEKLQGSIQKIPLQTAKKIRETIEELSSTEEKIGEESLYLSNEMSTYLNMWNSNLFLNDFYEEEEGVNIKLSELYMPLYYKWKDITDAQTDIEKKMFSAIEAVAGKRRMLLILGQPGIGKSSLVAWFANKYQEKKIEKELLIYRFSSFEKVMWNNRKLNVNEIIEAILKEIGVKKQVLCDKVIFLEGFDEIAAERVEILNCLHSLTLKWSATIFVTCRENYIENLDDLRCQYITLQPWNEGQISDFSKVYQTKSKEIVSDVTINKMQEFQSVFGIPLITYMVLALKINLDIESSVVDVYDKIFDENGGIYKRCINQKEYGEKHRIGDFGKEFRKFNKEIALWILKNNFGKQFIQSKYYKSIAEKICKKSGILMSTDFFIGCYYKTMKHTETGEQKSLYFVHRTILEYFIATAIYEKLENEMIELSDENQRKAAKVIAECLSDGIEADNTITDYLVYKIEGFWKKNNISKEKANKWWQSFINNMLKRGIFYFSPCNKDNKNLLFREIWGFGILIKLFNELFEKKYIGYRESSEIEYACEDYTYRPETHVDKNHLEEYIRCYFSIGYNTNTLMLGQYLNFSKFYLSRLDLSYLIIAKTEFRNSNLEAATMQGVWGFSCDFHGANMKKSEFIEAHFIEANFSYADLRMSFCFKADFREANFEGADLRGVEIKDVNFTGANMRRAKIDLKNVEKMRLTPEQIEEADIVC